MQTHSTNSSPAKLTTSTPNSTIKTKPPLIISSRNSIMPPPFISLLVSFISLLALSPLSLSQVSPPPRATLIDCGATAAAIIEDRQWLPDDGFISSGTSKNISAPVLIPTLSTVRSFPLRNNRNRKFCYVVGVFRGAKYMIRSTYFYGGVNGDDTLPPVFDQIVDGTVWSRVNTTEDYRNGMFSYYEGVFLAAGKTMSFCLGANSDTQSDPFISALEFVILGDSLYNSTDFTKFGLRLVARHSFGHNGTMIRYPDDPFDRFWEPAPMDAATITSNRNVSVGGIWNRPPRKIFETQMTTSELDNLKFTWPSVSLPNANYSIALYFADDGSSSSGGSRALNVSINGVTYYRNLTVTSEGIAVFAALWPLGGLTTFSLSPAPGSRFAPLINAGEVFHVVTLGGRTLTRDVIALEQVKRSFQNPPVDWTGDPCMPRQYSWTGITCSEGPRIRVVTLNLTSMGLSGSISPDISRLTALTDIWLGDNNLSGSIPDLSSLRMLERLFLENNNLTGQIPSGLISRLGPNLRTSPGNQFLSPPLS